MLKTQNSKYKLLSIIWSLLRSFCFRKFSIFTLYANKEINKIFFSTVLPQFWYFYCMKVCCLWRKVEVPVYLLMDWQTFGVYSAGTVERRWRWRDRSCSFFKNTNNRKINDWRTECFKTEATTECRRSHGFAFHPLRASRSSPSGIFMINTCWESQHICMKEGIFIAQKEESQASITAMVTPF